MKQQTTAVVFCTYTSIHYLHRNNWFCWIFRHIDISGNENADQTGKSALN